MGFDYVLTMFYKNVRKNSISEVILTDCKLIFINIINKFFLITSLVLCR